MSEALATTEQQRIQMTAVGLAIAPDATLGELAAFSVTLGRIQNAVRWAIVDLVVALEQYDEGWQHIHNMDLSYERLRKLCALGAGFPHGRRRPEVSVAVYEELRYGLSHDEQERLLDRAARDARHGAPWTRAEAREEAQTVKAQGDGHDLLPAPFGWSSEAEMYRNRIEAAKAIIAEWTATLDTGDTAWLLLERILAALEGNDGM